MIKIADIVFSVTHEKNLNGISPDLDRVYQDFFSVEEPEITVNAHFNSIPDMQLREEDRLFDSETVWSLYKLDNKKILTMCSPATGLRPYRIAVFDADYRHGEIYSRFTKSVQPADWRVLNPLAFPLCEVLMVCLLGEGRGLMIHACGIDDNGEGYLFAGNSGDGKTTMARLWKDHAVILNDDRIVLRYKDGSFWMYGTPWHGEYTGVSSSGVVVRKLFFLRHGNGNEVVLRKGSEAASMLLARCFPPLWDAGAMQFTLDFCARLIESVPCYDLNFVPDRGVMDLVRCVK